MFRVMQRTHKGWGWFLELLGWVLCAQHLTVTGIFCGREPWTIILGPQFWACGLGVAGGSSLPVAVVMVLTVTCS